MKITFKKHTIPFFITVFNIAVFIFLTIYPMHILQSFEVKAYDWRFQLRGERPIGDEVAIIAIDEKAINSVGRWPWSRTKTAELIDAVSSYGPRVVGIDVIFSEPEKSEGLRFLNELRGNYAAVFSDKEFLKKLSALERGLNPDDNLARAVGRAGNVVLPLAFIVPRHTDAMGEGLEPGYIMNAQFLYTKEGSFFMPYVAKKVLAPLKPFVSASASLGHIYTTYDSDGTIRWEPLSIRFKDSYYPSFGLEIARLFFGLPKDEMSLFIGEGVSLADEFIDTDEAGRILINYAGPSGTIPQYSAADVMTGKVPKEALADKAVLIGTTAIGTFDIHVTPYANMAGVEKQASVVESIIHGSYITRAEYQWLMVAGFILLYGAVLGIALQRLKAFGGAVLATLLFASYFSLAYYLFAYKGLWIDILTPSLTIFFSYASLTGYRYMTEERRANEIKGIFSSYVTEKVVNELVKNPEMAKLGGARKEITVLFSDIRGFTTFSERHQPEEVVAILNEYLKTMTEVVFRWDGTLDKFVGDAVMVFWNAPTEQANHAELALRCSLDMIGKLRQLREKWLAEGREPLDIGIGINTGEVIVGNMGAEGKKMDYTVIGDHVNLGARAEGLTRNYDSHIIITEFTYSRLKELFDNNRIGHVSVRELDSVKVKGKEKPVVIYNVVSVDDEGTGPKK